MGIIYKIDSPRGMLFVVWDGVVTVDDWYHNINNLLSEPAWSGIGRVLVDLQSVIETSAIGDSEIQQAVQIFATQPLALKGKQMAVIALNAFGKARRFAELITPLGPRMVVFNNTDTACLFLNVDMMESVQILHELRQELRKVQSAKSASHKTEPM